jgi:hypothetical protein
MKHEMTMPDFLAERARERDRFELDLSDAFDVKANIVLLILTFLGTISAMIVLAENLGKTAKILQIPVIAVLVVSGLFCLVCLWPKDYLLDDTPEVYMNWANSLAESEAGKLARLTQKSLELANGRIGRNHRLNDTKDWSLNRAFWSMTVAFFFELGAVTYLAFAIRPS